jgi:hypothetical protein
MLTTCARALPKMRLIEGMTCGSGDLSRASPPETPRAKPKGEKVPASLGKCSWKQVNRAGIMSHGLESNRALDVNVALLAMVLRIIHG